MSNKLVEKTVNLSLVGVDGNAYVIMATFRRQAQKQEWSDVEIELVLEEAQSKDYNHLLSTILDYCQVEDND